MRSPRPSAIAEDFGEKNEAMVEELFGEADFGDSEVEKEALCGDAAKKESAAMAEELFGVEKELCGDAAKKESDAMVEELFGVPLCGGAAPAPADNRTEKKDDEEMKWEKKKADADAWERSWSWRSKSWSSWSSWRSKTEKRHERSWSRKSHWHERDRKRHRTEDHDRQAMRQEDVKKEEMMAALIAAVKAIEPTPPAPRHSPTPQPHPTPQVADGGQAKKPQVAEGGGPAEKPQAAEGGGPAEKPQVVAKKT